MSTTPGNRKWSNLLTGRWHAPLVGLAAVTFALAVYSLRPPPLPEDIQSLLTDVALLAQTGRYTDAADSAANLLSMEPPLPEIEQARLHRLLANLIYDREQQMVVKSVSNLDAYLDHYKQMLALGLPESAHNKIRRAHVDEWLGKPESATYQYRHVLEMEPEPEQRRIALQRLVRLLRDKPDDAAERRRYLYTLLNVEAIEPAHLWWALREAMADALNKQNTVLARQLLTRFGKPLDTADFEGYFEFLNAWILLYEGQIDEAIPVAHWVHDWLSGAPRVSYELDEQGDLTALNSWLIGRIELDEQRPESALIAFDDVLAVDPDLELATAASVGRAQALAMLERHAEATEVFQHVAGTIQIQHHLFARLMKQLEGVLRRLINERSKLGELATASGYLEVLEAILPPEATEQRLDILERLGDLYSQQARALGDPNAAAEYHRKAGQEYEQAIGLCGLDAARKQGLIVAAAEAYDRGGWVRSARQLYEQFVQEGESTPQVVKALYSIAEGYELEGDCASAVTWYQRLFDDYPNTGEAARARVAAAGCLMGMGPDSLDQAAALLQTLLDGDLLTPEAPSYRDAYLRMSEIERRRGDIATAISRLEAFQQLFPDDQDSSVVLFQIAENYRHSAEALTESAGAASAPLADADAVQAESLKRYALAANYYQQFIDSISDQGDLDEVDLEYERLALFSRGDCLFAMNTPDSLEQALATYQQAVARYELEPTALAAQVQVANTHLRMGRVIDAARAIERARWLLRNIPSSAFANSMGGATHAEWDRYLGTLAQSELFAGVLSTSTRGS
jgi:tetratricopeptide (TPR) repeat protein